MCDFCENGKFKEVDGYDNSGLRTMKSLLSGMIGKEENGIFIDVEEEYFLVFDNSSGEYTKGAVKIAYCPMCGRKLSEETENTSLRDRIIEKIKQTEPDYINYRDFYTKYGRVIPGIGDKWH